jgi:hypothetical protein
MVRVFRQKFTPEDAIGSHACSLEANMRVTNGIPLGCPLLLPVVAVNCVQTLKGEPYDTDVRLPMYVRGPGVLGNRLLPHPTNHLDITATIVELARAQATAPSNLDGLSFVRCAFFDRILHSMMPLDPTHVRFKRTCV